MGCVGRLRLKDDERRAAVAHDGRRVNVAREGRVGPPGLDDVVGLPPRHVVGTDEDPHAAEYPIHIEVGEGQGELRGVGSGDYPAAIIWVGRGASSCSYSSTSALQ